MLGIYIFNTWNNIAYLKTILPVKSDGACHWSEMVFFGLADVCVTELATAPVQFMSLTRLSSEERNWPTVRFHAFKARAWMMKPVNGWFSARIRTRNLCPRLTNKWEEFTLNGAGVVCGNVLLWTGIMLRHVVGELEEPCENPTINWKATDDKKRQINVKRYILVCTTIKRQHYAFNDTKNEQQLSEIEN